jgi:hypothetical protein
MDFNSLLKAMENSKGVPTASMFKQIDQARVSGTLKKPPLSHVLEVINSRPPVMFPEVEFDQFKYSPLPTPTSIRLLAVGPEDENGLLRCFLDTFDLNDEPLYNCLSYTWVCRRWQALAVLLMSNRAIPFQREVCGPGLMK